MERIEMSPADLRQQAMTNKNTYLYIGLVLIVISARLLLSINIPVIVILAMSLLPALLGNENDWIIFAICCIPLSTSFQYKYTLFVYIFIFLIKSNYRIRITQGGIAIIMMMVWEFSHIIMGNFSVIEFFRTFAELLFLLVLLSADISKLNYKKVIRAFAIATIGVCVIMLLLQLKQFNYNFNLVFSRGFRNYRFGIRNTDSENFGLNFNSNRLGFICNLTTTGILTLIWRKEHRRLDIVLMILSMLFGLLTLSRTYFLCLLIIISIFIISIRGSLSSKMKTVLGIVLVIGVLAFVFVKFFPNEFANLIERFSEEDLTNGRTDLFRYYHNHIWSSPIYFLYGVGLQNYGPKVSNIQGSVLNVCHNGYQEIMVCWGIVGLFLFAVLIMDIIMQSKRYNNKHKIINYLPLILILISTFAGQFVSSEIILLGLSYAYVMLSITDSDNKYLATSTQIQ